MWACLRFLSCAVGVICVVLYIWVCVSVFEVFFFSPGVCVREREKEGRGEEKEARRGRGRCDVLKE